MRNGPFLYRCFGRVLKIKHRDQVVSLISDSVESLILPLGFSLCECPFSQERILTEEK